MKTMNKEKMNELNLDQMETISGGDWKEILGDVATVVGLGPLGEFIVFGKHYNRAQYGHD